MIKIYPRFSEEEIRALGLEGAMPKHVGLIMDGNGRWAKKRLLPRSAGHRAGMEAMKAAVRFSHSIGVEALTVYAFSTENWKRPQTEVDALFALLSEYFYKDIDELDANNVRMIVIGDLGRLAPRMRGLLETAMERTKDNTGLVFNVAINYGGRAEIVHAVRELIEGGAKAEDVTEEAISAHLYTRSQPDPDVIIRTAGEQRLSNFLLWQAAYSEFVFTPVLFPDFDEKAYTDCIKEFMGRTRRFGKVL
ncbi:MAG: isoprenyl transferase [Clostridia bacterium]|nr:isoprenyl transferase [Clostridia bacterium]